MRLLNLSVKQSQWLYQGLFLLIILTAAWLRFWHLSDVPPGLDYDEAYNGLDATWMLENQQFSLFFPGNNGREALFFYPIALFIKLLGNTPLALRLPSALAGILAVAAIYRLSKELFLGNEDHRWLGLIAAAGLAVSFWHLSMSRMSFRSILVPTFLSLISYLFLRGWRIWVTESAIGQRTKQSYHFFALAGIALGLSLYTYPSVRLIPGILLLFVFCRWIIARSDNPVISLSNPTPKSYLSTRLFTFPWFGLLLIGIVSFLVFLPLAITFLNHPEAFTGRTDQINYQVEWTATGLVAAVQHVAAGLSLFVGGADPRIRYHLVERPVFDWLTLFGFWVGLMIALKKWRQPAYLFLLLSLGLMWLPGPLSVDPIHNLRASGILPAFFILVAVGLFQGVRWGLDCFRLAPNQFYVGLGTLGLVLFISGSVNTFDYFVRWANDPRVYREYEGSEVELARYAANLSRNTDVILLYNFYDNPHVRYLLHNTFQEKLTLPFNPYQRWASGRPIVYLSRPEDKEAPPLFVWLTRGETGLGKIYLTGVLNKPVNPSTKSWLDSRGQVVAETLSIDETLAKQMFKAETISPTAWILGDHIRVTGYQFFSQIITPLQPGLLTLYWQNLEDTDLAYNTFIQILNAQGEPINQLNEPVIRDSQQYYSNRIGLVYQQHSFWVGPDTPAGIYFVRLGLFNPKTGQRLGITTDDGQLIGDQLILTPFYVAVGDKDPRLPDVPLKASLNKQIHLLGYSLIRSSNNVKLYWQVTDTIERNYTIFLQLLDDQNQIISQHDAQPLNGLFPTSRWQTDQVIITEFTLPVTDELPRQNKRLVTGMYDLDTGIRLPVFNSSGQRLPNDMITLIQVTNP